MKLRGLLLIALIAGSAGAKGQFTTDWFHDEKRWGDGKAEYNLYEATQVRDGQPRQSEVTHLLVREAFSPKELVKTQNGSQPGAYGVIKLNQVLRIPAGLVTYQQMHSAFWRVDSGALIKATVTSHDSLGNTFKEFRATDGIKSLFARGWHYEWRTFLENMVSGTETFRAPAAGMFYEELPVRVRTIAFGKGEEGAFEIQLARSVIHPRKDTIAFEPARLSWRKSGETLRVEVTRGEAKDVLVLDGNYPHMLREWQQADGGMLKLRRSLRIDYWNHTNVGDRERALGE